MGDESTEGAKALDHAISLCDPEMAIKALEELTMLRKNSARWMEIAAQTMKIFSDRIDAIRKVNLDKGGIVEHVPLVCGACAQTVETIIVCPSCGVGMCDVCVRPAEHQCGVNPIPS